MSKAVSIYETRGPASEVVVQTKNNGGPFCAGIYGFAM
jgi:hypothetical protein